MIEKLKKWILKNKVLCVGIILMCIGVVAICYKARGSNDKEQTDLDLFYACIESADKILYTDFLKMMDEGLVDTVYYSQTNENMVFTIFTEESKTAISNGEEYKYTVEDCRTTKYPAGDSFRERVLLYGCNLVLVREKTSSVSITAIISLLSSVVLIVLSCFMIKKLYSVGNIKDAEVIQTSTVKLDDIIGLEETKEELSIIISLIKNTVAGEAIGAKVPHGILLSGPPGVGKTMVAKAISNAAGVPFISMNGSDFQEMYVGTGAKHVRELFRIARQNAPCIIFIDEFDAIGESRDSKRSSSEDRRTINALLKEMDGFKALDNVFVLAATNYPELLDSAITRSGRFDREIVIRPPKNWEERFDLFKHYLRDKRVSEDIDLVMISKTLSGYTGADIATVCNEAALVAMAAEKEIIDSECIETAIDRKIFKGAYSKRKVNEEDRKIVAYHEAGHAVASILLGQPVSRASIKSMTSGVGGAVFNEDTESQFIKKGDLKRRIMVCYSGRIAEELFFDDITAGAVNDIQQASSMLYSYICTYGFDEGYGLLNLRDLRKSESTEAEVQRMKDLSSRFYTEIKCKLSNNEQFISNLAERLLEVETMTGKEISEFLNVVI